ncbi:hypothetical protein GOBAR_AA30515 [Gossypium barbadense]|uniref:Protein ARV n=1 Tax=Gossypium barbadense TaxID=3634 RepID=A0A2P5WGF2_GOSBA|nr:hypothetical protein GOBAR_AA30515 [Gossypium barbadense]
MEYRCVQCGFRIKTLFVQYSPGNIRLMKCVNCKAVADEYIECELMIVLIDLILHKPKAYRHVLFNVLNHERTHFQMLMDVFLGNYMFLCSFLFAIRSLLKTSAQFSGLLWKSLVGFLVLDAVQRSVACNSNFKLLQDSSHCHDGLLSNATWPTD